MPGARIINGEQITFRTVESEDIPFLQRAYANPEIRYPFGAQIRNQEQFNMANIRGPGKFLVCLEADDIGPGKPNADRVTPPGAQVDEQAIDGVARIGSIEIMDANWKRPELGTWFVPEVHDEGYAKESIELVIDYIFREYDTPAIGAQILDFNDAANGLVKSLGFTEEGRCRKSMFVNGAYRDLIQYGLLRSEWQNP